MQTVLATPVFLRQAKEVGLDDDEIAEIVGVLASNPMLGDVIPGTGGARKLRHGLAGKGKSGGLRTIHFFGGTDIPVFLLAVYAKNTTANLTKAERNQLSDYLPKIAAEYRKARKRRS